MKQQELLKETKVLLPYLNYIMGYINNNEIINADKIVSQDLKEVNNKMIFNKNLIFYGPPGTGKTYTSAIYAVAICDNKSVDELTDYDLVMKRYNELKKENRITFITFHQSYSYEEFIEGLKPNINRDTKEIEYYLEDGIFKAFCKQADQHLEQNYVFIIDEINRGNISQIFGELITLIEQTKRKGTLEAISTILPNSKEEFSIPSNVYIIGTMNTADPSIALIDRALCRRFQFIEMMPNLSLFKDIYIQGLNIKEMIEIINKRIEILYDREHIIGQAFFIELLNKPTMLALRSIFENSLIPLLQEYFYEDYQKIQFILGDNAKNDPKLKFILDIKVNYKKSFKGNIDDILDLPEKQYMINPLALNNIDSYKQIL